jgi:outer membrane protein assembly factor BamB
LTLPTIEIALAPKPRLATAPVILGGSESAATRMVIAAYQQDGSLLLGFDPVKRAETWRSPLLSEQYYETGISADAARVYVADGATLMALDRNNGQMLWQTSLANNIQTGCAEVHPCLQRVGDQVVALARDGTVQGFAGSTGAPVWSRRLNSQPRQFLVNNDQVILVDNDANNRAVVLILNGANGDLVHELQPSCTFPNLTMRPHSSDQFLVTPDRSALLVVGSGTYACAWRYNLSDGALTWSYTPPGVNGPLPFTWSMSSLAVADPTLYFVKDDGDTVQIFALDSHIEASTPQPLYSVAGYELTVLYPLGDLLLVSATPDYARDEVELWAIDRANGDRRWQRKLETTHSFDEWVTRPTDQGIFLMVCSWNEDDCRFEVLDFATGTSKGQVREQVGTPFSGAAWLGNQGFLTLDGTLYAIDLRSAAIEYTWP